MLWEHLGIPWASCEPCCVHPGKVTSQSWWKWKCAMMYSAATVLHTVGTVVCTPNVPHSHRVVCWPWPLASPWKRGTCWVSLDGYSLAPIWARMPSSWSTCPVWPASLYSRTTTMMFLAWWTVFLELWAKTNLFSLKSFCWVFCRSQQKMTNTVGGRQHRRVRGDDGGAGRWLWVGALTALALIRDLFPEPHQQLLEAPAQGVWHPLLISAGTIWHMPHTYAH